MSSATEGSPPAPPLRPSTDLRPSHHKEPATARRTRLPDSGGPGRSHQDVVVDGRLVDLAVAHGLRKPGSVYRRLACHSCRRRTRSHSESFYVRQGTTRSTVRNSSPPSPVVARPGRPVDPRRPGRSADHRGSARRFRVPLRRLSRRRPAWGCPRVHRDRRRLVLGIGPAGASKNVRSRMPEEVGPSLVAAGSLGRCRRGPRTSVAPARHTVGQSYCCDDPDMLVLCQHSKV